MKINYQTLEKKIKINFKDKDLLVRSLTHKSYNKEINNEKLEFLGDRVLGLVIAKKLLDLAKVEYRVYKLTRHRLYKGTIHFRIWIWIIISKNTCR